MSDLDEDLLALAGADEEDEEEVLTTTNKRTKGSSNSQVKRDGLKLIVRMRKMTTTRTTAMNR